MGAKRRAVSLAFLFFGVQAGSLLPRIPALKESLRITDGEVGIAFLAYGVGAVIGVGAGRLVLTGGARRPVRLMVIGLCVALVATALAPGLFWLAAAFSMGGVCSGLLDVTLNAQAAEVERDAGRPMINGFHGYWSLGSIAGAVVATGAAALSMSPTIHFTVVAVVMTVASVPLLASLPNTTGGAASLLPAGAARWHVGSAVLVVAVLGFLGFAVEGAGADWSAIYLRDFGHAAQDLAAVGFAALTVAMTVVRFGADRLTAATSPRGAAAVGGLVAALGFALAIAVPAAPVAIAGFALVGAGTAVLVPLAFSAASNLDEAGNALGIMTALGYAGSLIAPPLIGATADRLGLRLALLIPMAGGLIVVAMMASTRVLSVKTQRRPGHATEGVESKA